jgi:hypothetical protein
MATKPAKAGATKPPKAVAKGNPKNPQSPKPLNNAAKPVNPPPGNPPSLSKLTGTGRAQRPLPAKSVQKAVNAFKNFSLSRFAKGATPANYVPAGQAKTPSAVAAVQRKSMATQTVALAANPPQSLGLTLALSTADLAQLLPSLDAKAGTVDLTELLGVLQQNLQGAQFYASGNPILNRVVQDSSLLSQVQAYIQAIKGGGAANVGAAVNPPAAAKQGAAAKAGGGRRVAAPIRKGGA